jgi:hypothetical protein
MSMQHIGQDFSYTKNINLLPGFKLPRGVYQTNIQYLTDTGGIITVHHMSQNMHGGTKDELVYSIGVDVREITFEIYCHNSFPTNPLIHYRYYLRVDRLILLNLAVKLLK